MPTIFVPAEPYPKKANDNIRSSDWNAAINEVARLSDTTQYLDRNTFNGPLTISGALTASGGLTVSGAVTATGGINGPLTVNGALTVTGAQTVNGKLKVGSTSGMLEVGSLTTISQNTGGNWAAFGKNLYIAENGTWPVNDTSKPGVNFHMSADGADNKEFRFVRREAGSTANVLLASIGTGGLTVAGGITAPLTITGAVENALTIEGSLVKVRGVTTVATDTRWNWSSFGCNLWAKNGSSSGGDWKLVDTSKPGVCLYMGPESAYNSEFRFVRMDVNPTNRQELASIGTEGLTVAGGINGPITVKGALTVNGILGVKEYTRISYATSGNWAVFGANMYHSGSAWKLVNTALPGANLHMAAATVSGGTSSTGWFNFSLMDAGETNQRNIITMGTEGIVSNGKKVATGFEFLYMIRGKVEVNATIGAGSGFTVQKITTGVYQINFSSAFSSLPIAVANQCVPVGYDTRDNALIVGLNTNWIQIKVGGSDGTATDRPFTFIAVGPRN